MMQIISLIKIFCHRRNFDYKQVGFIELFQKFVGIFHRPAIDNRSTKADTINRIGNLNLFGNET